MNSIDLLKRLKDIDCHITCIEKNRNLENQIRQFVDQSIFGNLEKMDLNELQKEKFDVILIGDLLEHLVEPEQFLQKLRGYIALNGTVILLVHNVVHGSVRISMLNGYFKYNATGLINNNSKRFFTLDILLSLIDKSGYSLTKLQRINKGIFDVPEISLTSYVIPQELIDAILRDPESVAYQYVFQITPNLKNNHIVREFIGNFSKDACTEYLRNILIYYRSQMSPTQKTDLSENDISQYAKKIDYLIKEVEILQNANMGNRKLIDEYANKINSLVKEIETLQNINIKNQKLIEKLSK